MAAGQSLSAYLSPPTVTRAVIAPMPVTRTCHATCASSLGPMPVTLRTGSLTISAGPLSCARAEMDSASAVPMFLTPAESDRLAHSRGGR